MDRHYLDIDFPKLMIDFLKNGNLTSKSIGGEFPDYETYHLALGINAQSKKDRDGSDGCWLTEDRDKNNKNWWRACFYIISNKIQGRLAPFKQIYDFYRFVQMFITNDKHNHEVKWCKGAMSLVNSLTDLEGGHPLIKHDVETILNELNLGICDYAITQFYDLIFGKYKSSPLKGNEAYLWDKKFIEYEQGVVAPPIYNKSQEVTIKRFQNMADKDGLNTEGLNIHGLGSLLYNEVTPAFDDFTPNAEVTDTQFRIDLPLLMLYLDTHKPKWTGFTSQLKPDGTLIDKTKEIIRKYEIK